MPVSKTLRFVLNDTMNHRIVEEVRLADPSAADDAAQWGSPANVRTYADYMPYDRCKPCSKLPSLVVHADGTVDAYSYSAGDYTNGVGGAAGVFADSGCGEGEWFRTVVTHYARGLAAVPGLTTRDVKVEVRSSKKEVLREQYVCTGPGAGDYARVSWTATTRDALGQETLVVKSDGTRVRKTYAGRRLASMTDEAGLMTTYAYDALGRIVAEVKFGGGVRPDTRTTTVYDPEDRVLSRTVASGHLSETETYAYDALGRTVSAIDSSGIETRYLYAIDATAGLDSPRWSCSYEDALGRTICETRPGFRGALLVTSNEYNAANQLVATRAYMLNENATPTPLTYTYFFCYNSLGQRCLTDSDMNLNSQIEWNDTDHIVSNDTRYVMLDGDWWRESSSWQTRQNGSSALTRAGARPAHPSLIRSATATTL